MFSAPTRRRVRQAGATRVVRRRLLLEPLEDRRLLAGVPVVDLSPPTEQLIGEVFTLTATFDNTAADPAHVGYGPFVDLIFPVNGADGMSGMATPDGISFVSASYLGAPVVFTVRTFPDDGGGMGAVPHPYAVDATGMPLTVVGTAGDQLVVLQLPFGSFAPEQPPAAIAIQASLSNLADLGTPLTLSARGGFQFGCDPLNNPMTDPTLLTPGSDSPDSATWGETTTVTPALLRLTKTYLGPEDETATGPNFPRQYEITVDIATGQTVTDFDLTDALDNTMAFLSVDSTTSVTPATVFTFPGGLPPVGVPANMNLLTVNADTVTGGAGDTDLQVVFSFFIAEFDADGNRVIPLNGQDPTITTDTAAGVGDWVPLDIRDPATPGNAVTGPETHELQNKSIAIQKSFTVIGGGDPDPGVTVEFTLEFQVSDYYTFGDLLLEDILGDGLDWLSSFAPTFQVADQDGNASGMFSLGTDLTHTANLDGTETLAFDLSAAMMGAGAPDGILRGGLATAPDGDDSSPAPAAVGMIVFRATVAQDYDQMPPSTRPPIAQGDTLTNDITISGTVRDNDTPAMPIGPAPDGREGDDSSASGTIPVGSVSKSIYAVNGVPVVGPPPVLAPGDEVTYSLEYTLPISTFVDFLLTDYLPLPVFQVTDPDADGVAGPAWTFVLDGNPSNSPAPGVIELGPNDTFFAVAGLSAGPDFFSPPQINPLPNANALELFYGDFNDPLNQSTVVNLLLTVTATDTPFADALFLTNQVRGRENNSNLESSIDDGIVQIQLGQPDLNITKGVLATNAPAGVFSPAPPVAPPLSATAPGTAGFRLSGGTLNSDYLDATPLDSNLAGLDAGDLVTFAIVVENTGSSRRGAFDVALRDSLPAGFRIPTPAESPAELNLSVTDGTGAAIMFNNLGSGLFDPLGGIELIDPGPTPELLDGTNGGALDAYDATNGRNVLIVTFDLITDLAVAPREILVNTATLFNYAGAPGGPDHTAEDPTDQAQVGLQSPSVVKSITATNQTHTMLTDVAIGEIVTYSVEITLPEGTSQNVRLVDQLDSGLAFVGINSIIASPGVATSIPGGFAAVAAGASVANVGGGAVNQGRLLTLDFGTVTNSDTNNNVAETIVVSYDVVVLNSSNNNRGNQRNNQADWRWDTSAGPQQIRDNAPNVRIVEPTLRVVKDAAPAQVEAGDVVLYTIDVSHTAVSNANAYDVVLTDLIPPDTSYVMGSLMHTGGHPPNLLQESGGTVTVVWNEFPDDLSSQLQFEVLIMPLATAGSTITNTVDVTWTSLPGDITTPQSPYNTLSTERTGDPANPGGAANDYLTSDPASVTVRLPTVLDKSLVSTSEPHTAGSDVAIGEVVRYRLRGTLVGGTNPSIRIVDELPTGLVLLDLDEVKISFTSDTPIVAAPDLLGANNGAVPPTFVLPAGRISVGPSLMFDLGTLVNLDVDSNDEIVTIEFNALVLNSVDNNTGDVKGNLFRAFTGPTLVGISQVVDVTVREPAIINVDKQVVGLPPSDAGDVATYQVTFSNTGTATAFEVRVLDSLNPTLLSLTLPPVVMLAGGATGVTDNSSGNTVDLMIDQIPAGGSVTVLYTASLTLAVEPSQVIPNLATVTYSSLPGAGTPSTSPNNPTGSQTPGGSGAADGERDGTGGVNDYLDADDANVFVRDPLFTKSLVATDQTFTLDSNVAIGEIVTYQSVITIPEGTMPGAQILDLPDTGLAIVAVDSVIPNSPNVMTNVAGGFAQVPANANLSIPIDGSSVTIDLGTITNADNDPDAETLTITYRAVVLNTLANSRGFQLNNSANFTWSLGSLSAQAADVTIVEPALQIIKLNGNPILGDADDTITFELQVQHTPQSNANAFDVRLLDPIDSVLNKLNYVPGSVSVLNAGGAMLAEPPDETGGDLSITWSDFPLGASSTISFDVLLDISVGLNELLVNQAFLTWTSLPEDVTSPQSSNPYSVERTGDPLGPGEPGANDYASQDSGLVGTPTLQFAKEVLDSSELSTLQGQFDMTLTDLTIGETVTYGLIVGLPDGTFPNVVVTDNLPSLSNSQGVLEFVSASLVFVGADITAGGGGPLMLPAPVLTDTNGDGVADRIEFNLGTVMNMPDANGISEDDQFVVSVVARVLNTLPDATPVNFSGDTLTNQASVDATGLPVPFEDSVDVEIVEPLLTITKDTSTTLVDGGDTVTFTMTVAHAPASTSTAFDVAISDVLPAGMTYAGNVTVLSGAGPLVAVAGPLLTFSWANIPLGAVAHQFTFDVTVDPSVTPGQTFLNVGDLAWSTLPGAVPGERTYTDSDPADLITNTTTARNPIKTLVATSEAHTSGNDVAIGEIVRYRLEFEVTEGTLPNLRMIDTLDPGLQLVDPTQVFISFTSDVPMGAAPDLLGGNNGDQPPTHLVNAGRITLLGQQVIFDLGTITNNDNDADAELITLEYNVLVLNTSDTNNGDVLSNSFTVDLDGTPIGPANPGDNTVSVRVLEPLIDDVQKSVLTLAGDSVTYEVIFSNTGTTTAFDTRVLDMLPPQLSLSVASVSVTLLGGASGADASSSTPTAVDVRIAQMPVGSQAIIAYTASVLASGQTIPNTANVTYTSLPGTNGSPVNPTGSQTPGMPGAAIGERTGVGGVNDYLDSDSESLGSLGDRVWDDLNGNGVQDGGEPGLDGVTVTLIWPGRNGIFGDGDDVTLSTVTAGGGLYTFSGLPGGNYDVSVDLGTLPPGYVNTFDLDGNRNSQTNVALAAGQNRTDVDFGYAQSASAGGIKWNDTNGDGVQNGGESPLAGVTVFVDLNDNRVFEPGEPSAVTDAAGAYQIAGLRPGTYVIREVPPVGYRQTFPAG
ncbi:MAG: isopeptide-forming domain-containing fimbrial protein, partial [Pirellulaceae bacterium]|nr:isopeptide-forming domain-containing fimbrial protein [Pirellulaceae bacterium]